MDFVKHPLGAAFMAAVITALYLYGKDRMNKEQNPNSAYFKPAALNAILVYGIVYLGSMGHVHVKTPY